jgi:hypothetical protein
MKSKSAEAENQIAILQTMLSQIKFDDPKFKSLIENEFTDKHNRKNQVSKEIIRRLRIQNKKLLEQVAALRAKLTRSDFGKKDMEQRLGEVTRLNDSIAAALGSCPECWGKNLTCPFCSGNGSPGWKNINKRLFNVYILPSVVKLYGLSERVKNLK